MKGRIGIMRNLRSLTLLGMLALLGAAACDETTATGDSSLRILLTDAPSDYIAAAEVDIGEVELIRGESDGAPIMLSTDGTDGFVNLLDLQGTATATLAEADIEPGTYAQLRLMVEAARVRLADGYEFTDGTTEKALVIPSGAQTGIKLNLGVAEGDDDASHLEIVPGQTVLVLDFDVNQSFVIQGNPESPAGINGVLFTPTIRVVAEDVAASIAGTVSTDLAEASVAGLTVTAEPTDEGTVEAYQTTTATAVTGDGGSYTLNFLVPGTYVVTVTAPEGFAMSPGSQTVTVTNAQNATGVDFAVVSGS
jgi:hypothetical protein